LVNCDERDRVMDRTRFDTLVRHLEVRQPRRVSVGRGLAALVSLGVVMSGSEVEAKKGKKKKKKNRCPILPPPPTCPPPPAPPTCAQVCPTTCENAVGADDPFFCFTRGDGPLLCGTGAEPDCAISCTSDNDCVGTDKPYCITGYQIMTTGQQSDICGGPGAFCTRITACIT
jgi:hypothetical protein